MERGRGVAHLLVAHLVELGAQVGQNALHLTVEYHGPRVELLVVLEHDRVRLVDHSKNHTSAQFAHNRLRQVAKSLWELK